MLPGCASDSVTRRSDPTWERGVPGTARAKATAATIAASASVTHSARQETRDMSRGARRSAMVPPVGTIALLLAPLLISLVSWRALWVTLALAAIVAAVAFARAVPGTPRSQVGSLRLVTESLAQPGNIVMALLFACYVAQWTSIMVWLPTFLGEHGSSTAMAAIATALMVLFNAPGNLCGGWLLSRGIPRGRLVIGASIISALCELGMLSDAVPGGLRFALVLAFSFSSGVIPSSIFAGLPVHARSPQHISTGNGMVLQFSNIGQFFGP